MLSRTVAAFQFSVEKLSRESEKTYFWTFTFKEVPMWDEIAMIDYHTFMVRVTNHFPWLRGMRISELHKTHGLHFHAIVNHRIPLRRLKALAHGSGRCNGKNRYLDFGRMHVTECNMDTMFYLSKYLGKDFRKQYGFQHRRWGTIGGFDGVRCKDIIYETNWHRNKEELFPGMKIPFGAAMLLSHYSTLWVGISDWPKEVKIAMMNRVVPDKGHRENAKMVKEWCHPEGILYNCHVEECTECKLNAMGLYSDSRMCHDGWKLYQAAIFAPWASRVRLLSESEAAN
jgi:hypothetical protein